MVCKTKLAERQAAMRLRHTKVDFHVPAEEINRAIGIYVRALSKPPVRADDVTAELVRAGVKVSVAEQARKQLGIVEQFLPRTGCAWLRLPGRTAGPQM
jgi:hypothetical protein